MASQPCVVLLKGKTCSGRCSEKSHNSCSDRACKLLHDTCIQSFPVQPSVLVTKLSEGLSAGSIVVLHNVEDVVPVSSQVVVSEEEWSGEFILAKSILELSLKVAEVDHDKRRPPI